MAPNRSSLIPPLEPPDSHYLSAAEGWMMLGNAAEARQELERLSPPARRHPDVLEVAWNIESAAREWEKAAALASELVERHPDRPSGWIHRSFSLHELKRTQEAWDCLLPAARRFPKESIIPYNLACYACQLGSTDQALQWLDKAMRLGGQETIKKMALADRDLEPLWPKLKE